EIIVVDNASSDETAAILEQFGTRIRLVSNPKNAGFAAGQNQAIQLATGEWLLTLNPDVRLSPDFVSKAVVTGEADEQAGSVSGKLLRMGPNFEIPDT